MPVELRYAHVDDYCRISTFLERFWAQGHVYVRMPQLFAWTFGWGNLWGKPGYSFALAEAHGEIVGILGGIPFRFNCLGQTSPGVWLTNYMVRPDYRQSPTALRLLQMFRCSPYEAIIAFGNNPAVVPLYHTLGAQTLSEMPRHFAVLPEAVERMVHLLCRTYLDWSVSRAKVLTTKFRLMALQDTSAIPGNTIPPSWNTCGWMPWAMHTVGAARDIDYLTWRYINHPCFAYHVIAVPEGERTGLAIWRLETMRCTTPQGYEEIDRLGRLVEFLPTSRHNAQELLTHFWHALHEADALGADYYGYHGAIGHWLCELGFHVVQEHADGLAIPARFQPLDGKGGRIRSAVFVPDNVPGCCLDSHCVWYWTKSDADQDRPN